MKCTDIEFEQKIWSVDPTASISRDYDVNGKIWLFADWAPFFQPDLSLKNAQAYAVWFDGEVVKDRLGLFRTPTVTAAAGATFTGTWGQCVNTITGGFTFTAPTIREPLTYTIIGRDKTKQCECGSHSPAGQNHGTWCDLYQKEF